MQAVLSVAWSYQRAQLLTRRPLLLDEWLRIPNGKLDPSTALQQMCSEFKISYSIEYAEQRLHHDKRFTCLLRFEDAPHTITTRGPLGANKTDAKHLASANALKAADGNTERSERDLTRYFLRRQIAMADAADPRRSLLRGWLGVSHITSADIPAFERWAENIEKTTGPLQGEDQARIRSYYDRCLLLSRRGTLPILRSMFTETTGWLRAAGDVADIKMNPKWRSFRVVTTALTVITSSAEGSLRSSISDWYGSIAGRISVDLSSENLGGDQDDLTPTQATALRTILDAAGSSVADHRLQVSVYRQDNSAYLTLTSQTADLHTPLSDLAHLLNECVSYLACVQIENGWLLEARYVPSVIPTRLADLGRAIEATADRRDDLQPLAVRARDLLKFVVEGLPEDTTYLLPEQASELFARRTLI